MNTLLKSRTLNIIKSINFYVNEFETLIHEYCFIKKDNMNYDYYYENLIKIQF